MVDWDRTPDYETLDRLIASLNNYGEEVSKAIKFERLDKKSGREIISYLQEYYPPTFPQDSTHPQAKNGRKNEDGTLTNPILCSPKGIMYEEIGYWFLKKQIQSELKDFIDISLLTDSMMGWLRYNPGSTHDKSQLDTAKRYINHNGVERLQEGFKQIITKFNGLIMLLNNKDVRMPNGNYGYNETFQQNNARLHAVDRLFIENLEWEPLTNYGQLIKKE